MKKILMLAVMCFLSYGLIAQGFEIVSMQETYKGTIGDIIKVPLNFKNNGTRPITLIVRKASSQIGTSQRNYFCLNGDCLDQSVEDYIVKVEPGQTLNTLQIALEAGLVPGVSSVRYIAYNKSNPGESLDLEFNFIVEEKPEKVNIYSSRKITLQDVYPNPTSDVAFVDYQVDQDDVKAKIILHNVLGNSVGEYELSPTERKAKIQTADLNAGIYFYTLYVNGEAVMTRKIVKK
jgi:hypothetical protein